MLFGKLLHFTMLHLSSEQVKHFLNNNIVKVERVQKRRVHKDVAKTQGP